MSATSKGHPRPVPQSSGQQALWHLHQLDPESTAYHISSAMRLTGPLDHESIRSAWQLLFDRHAVLRTTYDEREETPIQEVHEAAALSFTLHEASGVPEQELMAQVEAEAAHPFERIRRIRAVLKGTGESREAEEGC